MSAKAAFRAREDACCSVVAGRKSPQECADAWRSFEMVPENGSERKRIIADKLDPKPSHDVVAGKKKLAMATKEAAAKKVAASKSRPPGSTAKMGRAKVEAKRHDERMKSARYKSARYKLESFVHEYNDMPEWKRLIEAIKSPPEMAPGKVGAALKPRLE